jgi:hypothetical protein
MLAVQTNKIRGAGAAFGLVVKIRSGVAARAAAWN